MSPSWPAQYLLEAVWLLVGALSVACAALRERQQTRWTAGRSRSAAALSVAGAVLGDSVAALCVAGVIFGDSVAALCVTGAAVRGS